jgi:hypothetical protein
MWLKSLDIDFADRMGQTLLNRNPGLPSAGAFTDDGIVQQVAPESGFAALATNETGATRKAVGVGGNGEAVPRSTNSWLPMLIKQYLLLL